MKKQKPKQYEDVDDYSNIIGVGSAWRSGTGKSKTAQIGFIRKPVKEVKKKGNSRA